MIVDMVSTPQGQNLVSIPDINAIRIERDRSIALEFLKRNESPTARGEIAAEFGLNVRLVYRAIEKQIAWAREEMKKDQSPTTSSGPDQTKPGGKVSNEILAQGNDQTKTQEQ